MLRIYLSGASQDPSHEFAPKTAPKGFETVQHGAAPFCTHGTKSIPSLGTQHHQTQQNRTVTNKF